MPRARRPPKWSSATTPTCWSATLQPMRAGRRQSTFYAGTGAAARGAEWLRDVHLILSAETAYREDTPFSGRHARTYRTRRGRRRDAATILGVAAAWLPSRMK